MTTIPMKILYTFIAASLLLFSAGYCQNDESESYDISPAEEKPPTETNTPTPSQKNDLTPRSATDEQMLADSLKDIPDIIEYTYTEKEGLLNFHPLEPLHERWKPLYKFYRDKMHLDLAFAYTTLYQKATAGLKRTEAAGDDFDFYGVWTLCDYEKSKHPSSIGFNCESRAKWTAIPPRQLGANIGSLWGTVSAFSRYDFNLVQLWWEYHLIRKKFGFRVGKMDLSDYFNLYTFVSSNFSFLNNGLTGDLSIAFPNNGLSAILGYKPTKETFIFAAIGDMNGDKLSMSFDSFFSEHEYFTALEFSYKPKTPCQGEGNYNVMVWHADAIKRLRIPESKGFAISMEQEFRTGFLPFLRYGHSDGKGTGITDSLGAGFGVLRAFSRKDDEFGLGLIWAKPKNRDLRNQLMCETFYRLQLTHHIQITPDFEVIFNPTFNTKESMIGVFSIRMRMSI
jgi:porin